MVLKIHLWVSVRKPKMAVCDVNSSSPISIEKSQVNSLVD